VGIVSLLTYKFRIYKGLFKYLDSMIKRNEVEIGGITVRTPLSRFNDLITDMGVNRRGDVIEAFNLTVRGNGVACDTYRNRPNVPYIPMICGGGEEVANKMLIQPNAYVPDMDNSKARRIKSLRTRFFLPNRIRWNTLCVSSEDYRASHIKCLLHGEDQFNRGAGEGIGTLAK